MTAASLTSEPEKLLPEGIALEDVTPTIAAAFADNACLIYSGEHRLYWRANARGYTSEATRAGRYTIGDAYERTRHCDPDKQIRFVRLSSPVSGTDMVERVAKAIHEGDPAVGCTWEEWVVYAEKHPHHLQAVEYTRQQAMSALSAMPIHAPIPVIAEAGERDHGLGPSATVIEDDADGFDPIAMLIGPGNVYLQQGAAQIFAGFKQAEAIRATLTAKTEKAE